MSAEPRATQRADYYQRNKDRIRAAQREYRAKNRDSILARQARWRDANREHVRADNTRRYREDPTNHVAASKRWKSRNPMWVRMQRQRTRARELGIPQIHFTLDQFQARVAYLGARCWICGTSEGLTIDHVKPFDHGGAHMLANIRLACGGCNSRKSMRWYGVAQLDRLVGEVLSRRARAEARKGITR